MIPLRDICSNECSHQTGYTTIPVVINSINIVSKNAVRTLLLQLISGGTLNNPSWTQPTSTDASETAMEVDSTSRIVTGGNIVWQAFSRDAYMVGRIDDINFHMFGR
jgi:hypothetical protein